MSGSVAVDWADEVSEPLSPGVVIGGRFEIVDVRGRGGMGSVYEAEDLNIGRPVAVKLLEVEDSVSAKRFAMEAKAASRISSRHVAAVYDFGQDDEHGWYLVMELLEGKSLDDVLAERSWLEPSEAAAVGADIAEALGAAHKAGVVHRDLKPANVMVLDEGGVKVVDFGIARIQSGNRHPSPVYMTNPNMILGTPIYISPEAVAGDDIGPPADLYALGVILFEMVTGRPPFEDEAAAVICTMHLRDEPPLIADIRPGLPLPVGFSEMVGSLLEKEPELRPRSAKEVSATLRGMSDIDGPVHLTVGRGIDPGAPTSIVQSPYHVAEPDPLPSNGRLILVAALVISGMALVGALLVFSFAGGDPDTTTATPLPPSPSVEVASTPSPEPPPPVPSGVDEPEATSTFDTVVVTRPAAATLRLDGELVASPFVVPNDGETHELEISAPAHGTELRAVRGDRAQHLEVSLRRARRRGNRLPALRDWR